MSDAPPPPVEPVGPLTVDGQPVNRKAIFLASFMTLIAAGIGFGVRAAILAKWGEVFGFTSVELGEITGFGLVGFGLVILLASLITDLVGYKKILGGAFLLHVLSAVALLAATPAFNAGGEESGRDAAYWWLSVSMILFSVANGLCEAAINPLVATLYPRKKTHYLNILHAGWPAGLVLGALVGLFYEKVAPGMPWEVPILTFMVPGLLYGIMVLKESFPVSESTAAGVDFGTQLKQLVAPLLIFLLLLQACVGYVELGTDSWITNITEKIAEGQGLYLFVYASMLMFVLRFFAGPIVEKINPIGLLLVASCLGALGLYQISTSTSVVTVWLAMTIYGLGKTFLWPTMLGVIGEKFPKGGAVTMGAVGGVGMLSAGLLGGPGIGYFQQVGADRELAKADQIYERYANEKPDGFLFFEPVRGIDNAKKGVVLDKKGPGTTLRSNAEKFAAAGEKNPQAALVEWWDEVSAMKVEQTSIPLSESDAKVVEIADTTGARYALLVTALVPVAMAVGYLLLLIYFKTQGGYQQEILQTEVEEGHPRTVGVDKHGEAAGEQYSGGVEGPVR